MPASQCNTTITVSDAAPLHTTWKGLCAHAPLVPDVVPRLSLRPVIDPDPYARFIDGRRQTRLTCRIEAAVLTDAMAASNVTLSSVMRLRVETTAGKEEAP